MIPEYTQESLELYIEHGLSTGSFLEAVLSNDLFKAMAHADDENKKALPELVTHIFNNIPVGAYGSPDKYRDWIAAGGQSGRDHS